MPIINPQNAAPIPPMDTPDAVTAKAKTAGALSPSVFKADAKEFSSGASNATPAIIAINSAGKLVNKATHDAPIKARIAYKLA